MRYKTKRRVLKHVGVAVMLTLVALTTRELFRASQQAPHEIDLVLAVSDVLAASEEPQGEEAAPEPLKIELHRQAPYETWLQDEHGNPLERTVEYKTVTDEQFALDSSFAELPDRLRLPYEQRDSTIFRSRLYAALQGKRLVRFYDSAELGKDLQAIVTLDPPTATLGVLFINSGKQERDFRLMLTGEDSSPLSQQELAAIQYTGSVQKLSDEQLAQVAQQDGITVDILSVRTVFGDEQQPPLGHSSARSLGYSGGNSIGHSSGASATASFTEGVVFEQNGLSADEPVAPNALLHRTYGALATPGTHNLHVKTLVPGGKDESYTYELTNASGQYVASVMKGGQTVDLTDGRITVKKDEVFTISGGEDDTFNVRQVQLPGGTQTIRLVLDGQVLEPLDGLRGVSGRDGDGVSAVFVHSMLDAHSVTGGTNVWKRATVVAGSEGAPTYEMELIAAGQSGVSTSTGPVNVLLILDKSSSMDAKLDGSRTRWQVLREAASRMVANILDTSAHADSKVAVIAYNNATEIKAGWTGKAQGEQLAQDIADWTRSGSGTHWHIGFEKGNELMDGADENAMQYIVYMSDAVKGSGSDVPKAIATAQQLNRDHPQARILTLGLGEEHITEVLNPTGINRYQDFYKAAYTADELIQTFEGFTNVIKRSYADPVIVDTLSEHVDFAEQSPTWKAWYCDAGSKDHSHGAACTWKPLDPSGQINRNGKTITWLIDTLGDGVSTLEDWTGYRLTYPVKVTNQGTTYPHTGETDTGTHSGQGGWRSNTKAELLTGGVNGMPANTFPHPVVRIGGAQEALLHIIKFGDPVGNGDEEDCVRLVGVQFELRAIAPSSNIPLKETDYRGTVTQPITQPGSWELYETDVGSNHDYQLRGEKLATITLDKDGVFTISNMADAVTWDAGKTTLKVFNVPVKPTGSHLTVRKALTAGTDPALLDAMPATIELRKEGVLYATATAKAPGIVLWMRNGVLWNPVTELLPPGAYTVQETDPGDNLLFDSIGMTGAVDTDPAPGIAGFTVQAGAATPAIQITVTNRAKVGCSINIEKTLAEGTVFAGSTATFAFEVSGGSLQSPQRTSITLTPDKRSGSAVISGLAPGNYVVTEYPDAYYEPVGASIQTVDNLTDTHTVRFVNTNRRTSGDERITLRKEIERAADKIFTIRLTDSAGNQRDIALHGGETTGPVTGLLYGVPYTVSEVNLSSGYRLEGIRINGAATSTFTIASAQEEYAVVVTNRYYYSPGGRGDRDNGGGGGGQRDTDPPRTVDIPDDPVPTTNIPDSQIPLGDIPDAGGIPPEALAICAVALIGIGILLRRKR